MANSIQHIQSINSSQHIPSSYIIHNNLDPLSSQKLQASLQSSSLSIAQQQHHAAAAAAAQLHTPPSFGPTDDTSDDVEPSPSTANPCWTAYPGELCSQRTSSEAYMTYTPIVPLFNNITSYDESLETYTSKYIPASSYFFAGDISTVSLSDYNVSVTDWVLVDIDWYNKAYIDALLEPVFFDQHRPLEPLRAVCNATDYRTNRSQYVFNRTSVDMRHPIVLQLFGYWSYHILSEYSSSFNTTIRITTFQDWGEYESLYSSNGSLKHINTLCFDPQLNVSSVTYNTTESWPMELIQTHTLYDAIGAGGTATAAPSFANLDSQMLYVSWFFRGYTQWYIPSNVTYTISLVGPAHFVPHPVTLDIPVNERTVGGISKRFTCQLNGFDLDPILADDSRSIQFSINKSTTTLDFFTSSFSDGSYLGFDCDQWLVHTSLPANNSFVAYIVLSEYLINGNQHTTRSFTLPIAPVYIPPADLVYAGYTYFHIPALDTIPLVLRDNNYFVLPSQLPPRISSAEVHVTDGLLSCSWSISYRKFLDGWYSSFAWILFNGVTWGIDQEVDPKDIPIILHIRPQQTAVTQTDAETLASNHSADKWTYLDTISSIISLNALTFSARTDGQENSQDTTLFSAISTSWPFDDVYGPDIKSTDENGLYEDDTGTLLEIIAVLPFEKYGGHLSGDALQCVLAMVKTFPLQSQFYYDGCALSPSNCTQSNNTTATQSLLMNIDDDDDDGDDDRDYGLYSKMKSTSFSASSQNTLISKQAQNRIAKRLGHVTPPRRWRQPLNDDTVKQFENSYQRYHSINKQQLSQQQSQQQQLVQSNPDDQTIQTYTDLTFNEWFENYKYTSNALYLKTNLFTFVRNRNLVSSQRFDFASSDTTTYLHHLDLQVKILPYPDGYVSTIDPNDRRSLFPFEVLTLNFSFPLRYIEFIDDRDPGEEIECVMTGTNAIPYNISSTSGLDTWLFDPDYNITCPDEELTTNITWANITIDNGQVSFTNITFPELTTECPLRVTCPKIKFVAVLTSMFKCTAEWGCYDVTLEEFADQDLTPTFNTTCWIPITSTILNAMTYSSSSCEWSLVSTINTTFYQNVFNFYAQSPITTQISQQNSIIKTDNNNHNSQFQSLSSSATAMFDDELQHLILGNSGVNAILGLNKDVALMSLSVLLSSSKYIFRAVSLVRPKAMNVADPSIDFTWAIIFFAMTISIIIIIVSLISIWICWGHRKCSAWWMNRYQLRLNDETVDSYFPRGYFDDND